ncbi:MAG: ABC transporter substrate-binding protein [Azospirillaceae bacterium]
MDSRQLRSRTALTSALALTGALVATQSAIAQDLIVNSYGARYEELILEHIIEPFEEEFGVDVVYDVTGSAAEDYARIRATNGAPGYDVVVMTGPESINGCAEGLLAPLTVENVPNMAHLIPEIQNSIGECGAIHEIQYMSLLYNTDEIEEAPTSWRVLGEEQYHDRIILPNMNTIMGVFLTQVFSVMEGGTLEDLDPGFAYFAEIAPNAIEFIQSSSIMANYIEDGSAVMTPYWSARAALLQQSGLPVNFVIPEEGTIPLIATVNIPAQAENIDLAYEFVNFWLSKERQEIWAQAYNVGTIRDDVDLPDDFTANQITSAEDLELLHLPDLIVIGENRSEWSARWMREISGLAQQ